jgi:hypothetical protein
MVARVGEQLGAAQALSNVTPFVQRSAMRGACPGSAVIVWQTLLSRPISSEITNRMFGRGGGPASGGPVSGGPASVAPASGGVASLASTATGPSVEPASVAPASGAPVSSPAGIEGSASGASVGTGGSISVSLPHAACIATSATAIGKPSRARRRVAILPACAASAPP